MRPARCFDPTLICLINGPTDFDIALPAGVPPSGSPTCSHCSNNAQIEACHAGWWISVGVVVGGVSLSV